MGDANREPSSTSMPSDMAQRTPNQSAQSVMQTVKKDMDTKEDTERHRSVGSGTNEQTKNPSETTKEPLAADTMIKTDGGQTEVASARLEDLPCTTLATRDAVQAERANEDAQESAEEPKAASSGSDDQIRSPSQSTKEPPTADAVTATDDTQNEAISTGRAALPQAKVMTT